MPKIELGEPLLDDGRLQRIAHSVWREFPQLLDHETDFVTWTQEPKEIIGPSGLVTKLPQVAVFGILSNGKLTKAAAMLSDFEQEDHLGNDPALKIFRLVAREHLRVLSNLEGLIEDGANRTVLGSDV